MPYYFYKDKTIHKNAVWHCVLLNLSFCYKNNVKTVLTFYVPVHWQKYSKLQTLFLPAALCWLQSPAKMYRASLSLHTLHLLIMTLCPCRTCCSLWKVMVCLHNADNGGTFLCYIAQVVWFKRLHAYNEVLFHKKQ